MNNTPTTTPPRFTAVWQRSIGALLSCTGTSKKIKERLYLPTAKIREYEQAVGITIPRQ